MVVSPVQKNADSGVYTCWARNKQGHSARRSGEVTVIGNIMISTIVQEIDFQILVSVMTN